MDLPLQRLLIAIPLQISPEARFHLYFSTMSTTPLDDRTCGPLSNEAHWADMSAPQKKQKRQLSTKIVVKNATNRKTWRDPAAFVPLRKNLPGGTNAGNPALFRNFVSGPENGRRCRSPSKKTQKPTNPPPKEKIK